VIGFTLHPPVLVLGALTGILYGLLAVGLVLVYRSNRVVNFAHGEMGAFGASLFSLLVVRWDMPYWMMLPVAMLAAGAIGSAAEVVTVRRLRAAPALMSVVATLGIGQLLLSFSSAINPSATSGLTYPSPPWMPTFSIGELRITPAYTAMLVIGPLVVLGLSWFLRRSRWGRALRAAAANPESARLDGIPAARMSSLAWFLAAALSALTAILISPTRGFVAASAFGPSLLMRALAAAVLARMDRLGLAFAAGIGIGVIEQVVIDNTSTPGVVEVVLFVVVVVGMLLQRPIGGRLVERTSWANVQPWRPLPTELSALWLVRNVGRVIGAIAVVATAFIIAVVSNATAYSITAIMSLAIVGLGATIVSGMLGELSLGLVAFGALGSTLSIAIATSTGNFFLAFTGAMVVSGALSVLTGLPALRARGLFLTVTTLSFAVATSVWALGQSWSFGSGKEPGRPTVGTFTFDTGRRYAWLTLAFLGLALLVAGNLRRGVFGRRLIAVRDNDQCVQSFGVSAVRTKLTGLFMGGAFAGIGVAIYTHSFSVASPESFPVKNNIDIVAMTIIGGIGLVAGPLLGALYIVGLPKFLPLDSAALAASSVGWLLLIMYVPGGLASLLAPVRKKFLRKITRRRLMDDGLLEAGAPDRTTSLGGFVPKSGPRPLGGDLLVACGVSKRYGGLQAVGGVDLTVSAGTIVGLIGPNGAGKTTFFELLGGFVRPDSGMVFFDGEDVTDMSPANRARLGLVRGFQDAALFASLTVQETIELALERRYPGSGVMGLIGVDRRRTDRQRAADDLLSSLGLGAWRDIPIAELSTGTRRICELASLVALEPRLLLLDEPSSGLAQREVEALGRVLRDLRDVSGLTIVVIEHDIALVMSVADQVMVMAEGITMRSGTPDEIRNDPAVIATYLGADGVAVNRSEETR
jgi:ABC-type branched-subunit amino acid transport system ATPase component/branched-subunit amino acid ABC-type transport system permease component